MTKTIIEQITPKNATPKERKIWAGISIRAMRLLIEHLEIEFNSRNSDFELHEINDILLDVRKQEGIE